VPAAPNGGSTFLGVQVTDAPTGGAQVAAVQPNSPAATAGLKVGDVIVGLDNTQVGSSAELVAALGDHSPGDKVAVAVDDAAGAERTLTVALGSR
jgi:putative serine protease PepD